LVVITIEKSPILPDNHPMSIEKAQPLEEILRQFAIYGEFESVEAFGAGRAAAT
jgi:hypothetical protein